VRRHVVVAEDPWRLHCAAHELGHMLVWQASGFEVHSIAVDGYGSDVQGWTRLTKAGKNLFDQQRCRDYLVGLLAGREADIQWARHSGRPFRERHSKADLKTFRQIHRHWWMRGVPVEELRDQARAAVLDQWSSIVRLAPRLAARGEL